MFWFTILFIKDSISLTKEIYEKNPYFAWGSLLVIFILLYFLLYDKILVFCFLLNDSSIFNN